MKISDIAHPTRLRATARAARIWNVPQQLRTLRAILPWEIERHPHAFVFETADDIELDALFSTLENSKPYNHTDVVEYRWKVAVSDANGVRLAEIYASAIAPYGMAGDDPFRFAQDDFMTFLEDLCR